MTQGIQGHGHWLPGEEGSWELQGTNKRLWASTAGPRSAWDKNTWRRRKKKEVFWSSLTWYHGPIEERGTGADIFLGELLVPHKIEGTLSTENSQRTWRGSFKKTSQMGNSHEIIKAYKWPKYHIKQLNAHFTYQSWQDFWSHITCSEYEISHTGSHEGTLGPQLIMMLPGRLPFAWGCSLQLWVTRSGPWSLTPALWADEIQEAAAVSLCRQTQVSCPPSSPGGRDTK